MNVVPGFVVLGCLVGCITSVAAQTAPEIEQAVRQQQLDIRQEQDILQREKRQRELETDFQQLGPSRADDESQVSDGVCFTIRTISFLGLDDLEPELVEDIQVRAVPYLDQCLYLAQLSEIARTLNTFFLDRGLVTTRAFLPEQSLRDGNLQIRILAGKVQGLQSETLTPRNLAWAFPIEAGDILNLRDIEQGLDQINRLPSNNATIDLRPGELPGQTLIRVVNPERFWLTPRLTLDGENIQQGDDYRARVDLFADDLAGVNDALLLNYNEALAERDRARSWGSGFDYSVPWGYNTLSLSGTYFKYKNIIDGVNQRFEVSGDSQVLGASFNHTLFRNRSTKLDGLLSLTTKDTNNFVEDTRIDVSSRQLSIVRLELRAKRFIGRDLTAFASLQVDRGLEIFGADDDDDGRFDARAQFRKYAFYGSLNKPAWRWYWGLSGQYQYSPDLLPVSEQIVVADSSLVAGFDMLSLAGSRGGWLRVDAESPVLWTLPGTELAVNTRLAVLKGWISGSSGPDVASGSTSAAELALQLRGHGFWLQLRVGKTLEPVPIAQASPDAPDVGLRLSYML